MRALLNVLSSYSGKGIKTSNCGAMISIRKKDDPCGPGRVLASQRDK